MRGTDEPFRQDIAGSDKSYPFRYEGKDVYKRQQYGFVEGRDYEFVPRVRPQDEGGRTVQRYVKDYRITLEMAKQLYKLHHFHKNDCFRSCEGQHCMGSLDAGSH